jgi:hypothetical protein
VLLKKAGLTAYDAFTKKFLTAYRRADATAAPAEEVAACIYGAVVKNTSQLRYPVGGLAGPLLLLRKLLPERWFFGVVKSLT